MATKKSHKPRPRSKRKLGSPFKLKSRAAVIGLILFAAIGSIAYAVFAASYGNIQVKSYIDDPKLVGVADVAVSGKLVQLKPGCNYGAWTKTWNTFHGCVAGRVVTVYGQDGCAKDPRTGQYLAINPNSRQKNVTVKAGTTVTVNIIYGPASAFAIRSAQGSWSYKCTQQGQYVVSTLN